jgi:hypothetical protein
MYQLDGLQADLSALFRTTCEDNQHIQLMSDLCEFVACAEDDVLERTLTVGVAKDC